MHRPLLAAATLLLPTLAPAQPANPQSLPKTLTLAFDLTLSPAATARLAQGEALILSASFDAYPTPAARRHANQIGRIDLLQKQREIPGRPGPATLTVSTTRMPLRWIRGPINLNVNVFSARHTSPGNLVSCDFFDGPLTDALALHPIPLHCSLIPEHQPTRALN